MEITYKNLFLCVSSQHDTITNNPSTDDNYMVRAQKLCEIRGGPPGLPIPNSPYVKQVRRCLYYCRRKATLNLNTRVPLVATRQMLVPGVSGRWQQVWGEYAPQ